MRKKRKPISLLTADERAAQQARHEALEERIRVAEAELEATGSAYARIPRGERLAYAIARAEAGRSAEHGST